MFLAACGRIPPIFVDQVLLPLNEVLNVDKRHDRAFLLELYQVARDNGSLRQLPGVEAMAEDIFSRPLEGEEGRDRSRRLDQKLRDWIFSRMPVAGRAKSGPIFRG
jgi:hypothetical protein